MERENVVPMQGGEDHGPVQVAVTPQTGPASVVGESGSLQASPAVLSGSARTGSLSTGLLGGSLGGRGGAMRVPQTVDFRLYYDQGPKRFQFFGTGGIGTGRFRFHPFFLLCFSASGTGTDGTGTDPWYILKKLKNFCDWVASMIFLIRLPSLKNF